ncbi:hypothetical protein UlMin_015351 [Ulmus minor]
MAAVSEASSAPSIASEAKPVIVRVKRKAFQSRIDAFWLEINERPLKRALLDFENLSVSDSSGKESKTKKKVFVQHVETVDSAETTIDVVQSFVEPYTADASERKTKSEERKHTFKKENQRQVQLLSKARQTQEVVAKNARFEQIWRSRKGKEAMHEKLNEMCHFYDVVRVEVDERTHGAQHQEEALEDHRIMYSYLPLLREFIPSAAEEVESDLQASKFIQDAYVYDYYTIKDEMDVDAPDASNPFPLVQVEDEDYCDGPDESEYGSDDSNAENNPLNDYPDEASEEEEDGEEEEEEEESEASDNNPEEESEKSSEHCGLSEDRELFHEEDDAYDDYNCDCDGDDFGYDDDLGLYHDG